MIFREFYAALGKLLYAAADIDGVISSEEKMALKAIIDKEIAAHENRKDAFGTNVAKYTGIEFDYLEDQEADARSAFRLFVDFIRQNRQEIDESMKAICRKVVKELVTAYYGINSRERALIEELEHTIKLL